jgi:hypothetical protein
MGNKRDKDKSSDKKEETWEDIKGPDAKELPEIPDGVPKLVITAFAYQKLLYWEALSKKNEISCFGVALNPNDLLRVTELYLPEQEVDSGSTDPTSDGLVQMYEDLEEHALEPVQFSRIWIHTHPGKSAPSGVDYATCKEVFGGCNWFVMLVKGSDGFTCYLYIMGDMPVRLTLQVEVDYGNPGLPSNIIKRWTDAFQANVSEKVPKTWGHSGYSGYSGYTRNQGAQESSAGKTIVTPGAGIPKGASPRTLDRYLKDHCCYVCLATKKPTIEDCRACSSYY